MVDEQIKLKKQLGGSDEVSQRLVRRNNSAPIRKWMWLSDSESERGGAGPQKNIRMARSGRVFLLDFLS